MEETTSMKTTAKLAATVLIGISLTAVAQGQPKLNCVKDVKYGQEFLAKFPDAGAACQEVKVVNGEKWIRFNAVVRQNKDNQITMQFVNSARRNWGDPLTFTYTPDATLTLDNKKKTVKA